MTKYHPNNVRVMINGQTVHDDASSIALSGGPMPTPKGFV